MSDIEESKEGPDCYPNSAGSLATRILQGHDDSCENGKGEANSNSTVYNKKRKIEESKEEKDQFDEACGSENGENQEEKSSYEYLPEAQEIPECWECDSGVENKENGEEKENKVEQQDRSSMITKSQLRIIKRDIKKKISDIRHREFEKTELIDMLTNIVCQSFP